MDNLQTAINKLRRTNYINFNQQFDDCLKGISKYFDKDEQKAFLLGYLFKNINFKKNLPKDLEEIIVHAIKKENLQDYFYHQSKPEFEKLKPVAILIFIVAISIIIGGTIQLINGNVRVGLGTRYLLPVVSDGGTKIIMGIGLLIAGLFRYKYERQKQKFIANIKSSNHSS